MLYAWVNNIIEWFIGTKITGSTCADDHPSTGNTPLQYYPLVTNLFTIIHDTDFSSSWTSIITASIIRSSRYLSSSLSRNGSRLPSDASKFNLSLTIMESGVLTQGISFQYNFSDEGFYIHNLHANPIALNNILRDEGLECSRIPQLDRSLSVISFVTFPFIFTTYSKKFCLTYVNVGNLK